MFFDLVKICHDSYSTNFLLDGLHSGYAMVVYHKKWNPLLDIDDLIFCKLKKLKKHEFNFFGRLKSSIDMNLIFCNVKKAQKHGFNFFASLTKLKKTRIQWFATVKSSNMNLVFASFKKLKNMN